MFYGYREGEALNREDSDIKLMPSVIEKVLLPKLTGIHILSLFFPPHLTFRQVWHDALYFLGEWEGVAERLVYRCMCVVVVQKLSCTSVHTLGFGIKIDNYITWVCGVWYKDWFIHQCVGCGTKIDSDISVLGLSGVVKDWFIHQCVGCGTKIDSYIRVLGVVQRSIHTSMHRVWYKDWFIHQCMGCGTKIDLCISVWGVVQRLIYASVYGVWYKDWFIHQCVGCGTKIDLCISVWGVVQRLIHTSVSWVWSKIDSYINASGVVQRLIHTSCVGCGTKIDFWVWVLNFLGCKLVEATVHFEPST